MSALAVDAISLEKMGVPVAAIGSEAFVRTTGRGMCRAHGYPDYPLVTVHCAIGDSNVEGQIQTADQVRQAIDEALPQVEKLLQKQA